ncbi:NADP-dependent oxidoreductase domain [Dillenia turbinata]|uniref:NADP-dependent oxidoreductase domain n=1 Tax=Dillenia turbinata TaxID=194707 RepID=A0AAN8UIV2_9MAGN
MAEEHGFQIPRVSKLGFGCMSRSGNYNPPLPEEDGIAVIKHALSRGIIFLDAANVYGGNGANEMLIGKLYPEHYVNKLKNLYTCQALKELPREKIRLATKFGIAKHEHPLLLVDGSPEYVSSCCEASLKHLDVEHIDMYYQHRVDTKTQGHQVFDFLNDASLHMQSFQTLLPIYECFYLSAVVIFICTLLDF